MRNIRQRDPEQLPSPFRQKMVVLLVSIMFAFTAGSSTGMLVSYYLNNSQFAVEVTALATYRPPELTTIYADDGKTVLAQFALERRIPIKESEIPQQVEDALLAIEDIRYYEHNGIDPYRIAGAVFRNVTSEKVEGASTITQQLAKNLFLYRDRTFTRKLNEWIVALQIERFYTKRQILEMYMNYVFLGAGSYGFEAGSRTYFGKSLKDLSLEEAALLAAIPKSPEYSPTRNPERALRRRNVVLDQMAKYFPERYPLAMVETAKNKPIELSSYAYSHSLPQSTDWDYPVEEIRRYLEDQYTTRVAQGGLKVYSTINVEAQRTATKALRQRLRDYARTRPWKSNYKDILDDGVDGSRDDVEKKLRRYRNPDWIGRKFSDGDFIKGLVIKIDSNRNEATIRVGDYFATIGTSDMGRSGKTPKEELRVGYLCEFKIKGVDDDRKTLKLELSQVPEVQASLVVINSKTGEVVAMVGGYDFHWNKFNNATQGLRQTGSAYKPLVYTAAVEEGWTPDSIVSGASISIGNWTPKNFDGSISHGDVPMKVALARSFNIAAVRLLQNVGVQSGAQMVRRFGITNPMAPNLTSALGSSEASLLELTAAYSAFPNQGVRMQPHMVRKVFNRDGSLLEEADGKSSKVTDAYTALTMVSMLRGVTSGGGTAGWASAAGHQLAGKTGTVNNHTDVWFIGFTPTYVTGVWMGNPNKKTSLGGGMTGSAGALPIFNAFMNEFMKDKDKDSFPPPPPMPPDIQRKNLSKRPEEPEETSEEESDVQTANEGSPDLLPRLSREVPVIAPTPQPLN